jgi:Raf kinase inhibitor-like YbhB/YbcL family protein
VKTPLLILTGVTCAVMAWSQNPPRRLAIEQLKATGASMTVTSPSFPANGTMPAKHADYGERISPELSWTGVPPSAKSLVVIVEDPDAKDPKPFVHWVLYDLPPSVSSLPESVPRMPRLPEFGGALQGRNSRGTVGYFGPHPPKGDPAHHYHFEVFAVDILPNLDPAATATAVLATITGHVVARGELVGVYAAP